MKRRTLFATLLGALAAPFAKAKAVVVPQRLILFEWFAKTKPEGHCARFARSRKPIFVWDEDRGNIAQYWVPTHARMERYIQMTWARPPLEDSHFPPIQWKQTILQWRDYSKDGNPVCFCTSADLLATDDEVNRFRARVSEMGHYDWIAQA